jgi:hypothetical protein
MSFIPTVAGGLIDIAAAGNAADAQSGGATQSIATDAAATAAGNAGIGTAAGLATAGLNPYATSGAGATTQLSTGLAPGGNLSGDFTNADMIANDPGYQFRIDQGEQAMQRAQDAAGISGGGAAKQLIDYGQQAGSSEYQNAFNRFTAQRQNTVGNLQTLANQGQSAANQQGAFGTTAANQQAGYGNTAGEYQGNAQVFSGNAQATGIINKANAYNGMLNGIAQSTTGQTVLGGIDKTIQNNLPTWLGGGGTGGLNPTIPDIPPGTLPGTTGIGG